MKSIEIVKELKNIKDLCNKLIEEINYNIINDEIKENNRKLFLKDISTYKVKINLEKYLKNNNIANDGKYKLLSEEYYIEKKDNNYSLYNKINKYYVDTNELLLASYNIINQLVYFYYPDDEYQDLIFYCTLDEAIELLDITNEIKEIK